MNQHLHRIIFNAARGCLMAVAETCRANGKAASAERGAPHRNTQHTRGFQPSSLQWVCWLAVGAIVVNHTSPVVWAQTTVMADPTAPRNQQPTVLRAGNSTVQVNIQTPNAAGLSRNNYKQFDILADGVILNNSRTQTNTNLGGWIEANPWLAKGTAKVILNQVNSIHPSLLKGPVEVAGQRADVIIANPAGISVNGGSFINASQVHLTTGTPQFENNNLLGYRVSGGTVDIQGLGLDTSQADYTAILSRAVLLNAKVWANDLKVVTGINDITVDSVITQVQPNSTAESAAAAPAFALDVSQLGGMYAGKIQLIGTEAGLGVRNAGTLQASQGPLEVSQDGWLSNAGSLRANQTLNIRTTGKIDNSGDVHAVGSLQMVSGGTQTHSGVTAALGSVHLQTSGDPKADIVSTSNALIAAGIQADGKFIQAQPLNLQADGQVQLAGETLTMGALQMKGESIDLMVNNGGDINKTLQQLGSDQSVKNILIAMGTAGVGATVQGQGVNAVISNTVTGCAAGTVSGSGCEQGAKTAALMSTAGEAYQSIVGYAANPGPGENRNGSNQSSQIYEPDSLGRQVQVDQGMNVIGLNKPGSFLSQGEALSRGLNQIPFVNATAGLHDYIFNANLELNFTLWNVPTMLPAALFSLPAALNNSSFSWVAQVKQPKNEKNAPAPSSVIRIDKPLPGNAIKAEGVK